MTELVQPARRVIDMPFLRTLARDPMLLFSILFLVAAIVGMVFAEWLAPYDPLRTSLRFRARLPSAEFLLGTDEQGRDILSRILFGFRLTLLTSIAGLTIGVVTGSFIGLFAAYFRKIDMPLMRLIDIILSFPSILIGLGVASATGAGTLGIILALGISTIGPCARVARSAALGVVSMEYISGAKMVGLGDLQILARYVLPNCISSIIVYATLRFGQLVLLGASLSFLGLGVSPPTPELGVMVSQGRSVLFTAPHVAIIPSVAILLLVLSFNVIGDAVRDALDPRMKV